MPGLTAEARIGYLTSRISPRAMRLLARLDPNR